MLHDIEAGWINCVIVKDLARSFRNYSDQGYYLDDWFPRHNVRLFLFFIRLWIPIRNDITYAVS